MIWGIGLFGACHFSGTFHTLVIISTTGCQELISKVLNGLEQMPAFSNTQITLLVTEIY